MKEENVISILSALAQETRLRIYRLLVNAGYCGVPAGHIGADLDIRAATLSFHLKEMKHAGIVTGKRQGRSIIYSANFESMNGAIAYLTENCCQRADCEDPETCHVDKAESAALAEELAENLAGRPGSTKQN